MISSSKMAALNFLSLTYGGRLPLLFSMLTESSRPNQRASEGGTNICPVSDNYKRTEIAQDSSFGALYYQVPRKRWPELAFSFSRGTIQDHWTRCHHLSDELASGPSGAHVCD